MIGNYFSIAWRSIARNKTFSILNAVGLSIGLACFLLIMLFVLDETSFDGYNVHADRIYRGNPGHLLFCRGGLSVTSPKGAPSTFTIAVRRVK